VSVPWPYVNLANIVDVYDEFMCAALLSHSRKRRPAKERKRGGETAQPRANKAIKKPAQQYYNLKCL